MKRQKKGMILFFILVLCSGILASITIKSSGKTVNEMIQLSEMKVATTTDYESEFNITWGGSFGDSGYGIALDGSGNIYITGKFDYSGSGNWDVFIAKCNRSGDLQWDIIWGGSDYDIGYDITLDGSGNIYITGYTQGFGPGSNDMFIAKYDRTGNSLKNISWGGSDWNAGYGIVLDGLGNIYITGTIESNPGDYDVFIAIYDSSYNSVKNITWGGSDWDLGYDIALDDLGNIYITGTTESYGYVGHDAFIAKYDSSYNSVKNITWGGVSSDQGNDIVIDSSRNIYITGYTYSFGAGLKDAFIAKYDSSYNSVKNITWGGDSSNDEGYSIALDSSGNIFITGQSDYSVIGTGDAFIAKYDSSGNSLKNITWGGSEGDNGESIVLDSSGNIYMTGQRDYSGTDTGDAFIAKFNALSSSTDDENDDDNSTSEADPGPILLLLIGLLSIPFLGIIGIIIAKRGHKYFSQKSVNLGHLNDMDSHLQPESGLSNRERLIEERITEEQEIEQQPRIARTKCPVCGQKLKKDRNSCKKCGARFY